MKKFTAADVRRVREEMSVGMLEAVEVLKKRVRKAERKEILRRLTALEKSVEELKDWIHEN